MQEKKENPKFGFIDKKNWGLRNWGLPPFLLFLKKWRSDKNGA
jgi:hypothetical protein